jgi:hypothetical protein
MLRMLIVGYCYGIRHERRLCEEVKMHPGGSASSISTTMSRIIRRFRSIRVSYGVDFQNLVRAMGIEEILTAPRSSIIG